MVRRALTGTSIPKVNLGGGGECPLFLVGIEPQRIIDIERAERRLEDLQLADEFKNSWRDRGFETWAQAKPTYDSLIHDSARFL